MIIPVFSWAQEAGMAVYGIVKDDKGVVVPYAAVGIASLNRYVTTDDSGYFEISGLPAGNYEISVQLMGYRNVTRTVEVGRGRVEVPIVLEEDITELSEVLLTGKTTATEIEESGFAVNVIETREAATRNLQTNDLLDRTVGVRIRQNGGLGSGVDYNLNGMSGNSVRVFIDGIPVSTYGSSFNLNSIPPALIERIEVYKGVIPVHLADDALGGAINVILKKGAQNILNASVSYGSFNTSQSSLNGTFRDKSGFTVKASGFYNYSDNDYEVWGKFVYNILPNGRYEYVRAKRFNDAYKSYGGRIEAGYTDVKWADNFLVGYSRAHDYNEIQHGAFMTKPYKGRFTESDAHVLSLNYTKKDIFVKGLDVMVNGVYSRREQVVNDTVKWNYNWDGEKATGLYGDPVLTPSGAQQGAPTINHIKRNILSLRAGLTYRLGDNHSIIFGNMFNMVDRDDRDEMRSELERRFLETRDLQKNVSSLAYEVKAFDSRLRTNVFGKYYRQNIERRDPVLVTENGENTVVEEVFDNKTTTFGYGLATSYHLTPTITVLASAEKAVRMPSENEVFGSPGENIVGNSAINPEISNNLNLGFRAGAYAIRNHRITVTATGFLRNTKDKIVRATSSRLNDAIQTLPYENLGRTQSVGFEAALDYVYHDRLFLSANMSKFNALFKTKYDDNGNTLPYYNNQLPNEPYFTINGNARYNFRDILQERSELNLFYNFGYVDPFYTLWIEVDSYRTPPQFVQDLGMSYTFPGRKFILSFDARNIFNKQVYDNYAVQKPGRAFYLKLNYTISTI